MNILVTGGTGVLGQKVVQALLGRGVTPKVLSRKARRDTNVNTVQGDLLVASSLPGVLANVEVILHCATNPSKPQEDLQGTKHLLEAAKRAGVKHFVVNQHRRNRHYALDALLHSETRAGNDG